MKKILFICSLIFCLTCVSCGDDEPSFPDDDKEITKPGDEEDGDEEDEEFPLSLSNEKVHLNCKSSFTLKASLRKCTWDTSNDFVASVDQYGKVTANHEGVATITVSKKDQMVSCRVEVNATNDNFNTIRIWGATQYQVKSNIPSFLDMILSNETYLLYSVSNKEYPWYGFNFGENGLNGSCIYFTGQMYEDYDFPGYIDQRFAKIEETSDDVLFANAYSLSEATECATVMYDKENEVWYVLFQPVYHTKGLRKTTKENLFNTFRKRV